MLALFSHLVLINLATARLDHLDTDVEVPAPAAAPMVEADTADWESPPLLEAEGELTSAPQVEPALATSNHHTLGVQVDVGVPDGVAASIVLSPLSWLRFNLAGLTNAAAAGVRLSVSVIPWHGVVRPSFTVEGGHYFEGDVSSLLKLEGAMSQTLSKVSYDFGSAQLGLDIGNARIAFLIRAGASYLAGSLAPTTTSDGVSTGTPHIRALLPSLKLGVLLCFG